MSIYFIVRITYFTDKPSVAQNMPIILKYEAVWFCRHNCVDFCHGLAFISNTFSANITNSLVILINCDYYLTKAHHSTLTVVIFVYINVCGDN